FLLQDGIHLACNGQVELLLPASVHARGTRILPAVARVDYDLERVRRCRRLLRQLRRIRQQEIDIIFLFAVRYGKFLLDHQIEYDTNGRRAVRVIRVTDFLKRLRVDDELALRYLPLRQVRHNSGVKRGVRHIDDELRVGPERLLRHQLAVVTDRNTRESVEADGLDDR